MAKGKAKKKTYRRHRIGAAGGMQTVAMNLAGIAVAVYGAGFIKKSLTSLSPTVLGIVEVGAGVALPRFIGKGNEIVKGVGFGLMAKGATDLMTSMGVITGIGAVPRINPYQVTPPLIAPKPIKLIRPIGHVPVSSELIKIGSLISN